MIQAIKEYLTSTVAPAYGQTATDILTLVGIAAAAVVFYYVTYFLLKFVELAVGRTHTTLDDDLFNKKILRAVSQLAPALVVKYLLPGFFGDGSYRWLDVLTKLYILATVVFILVIFLSNLYETLYRRPRYRAYAVKGLFQMAQLVCICIAVIYAISIMIGRSPATILTALGASAAVLMLVFKDTILGLVASVQLTANKMIRRGDWVVCESHHANGEVEDISLTTVKIRNWDNSVTTIPPYSLVSESFRNYQPMRRSGGRRVDRSVIIDANSVRFLGPDELAALREKGWLEGLDVDVARSEINLRLLRRYLTAWLAADPRVNEKLLLMVRQMEPTPSGLPLQLYFFCHEVRWKEFEEIQSDIFDHVYAIIGEFGLRVFQSPTGADLLAIGK